MLKIDFSQEIGKIKPMHATGQPPFTGGFLKFDFSHMHWLRDAGVPYSRLHDVGGSFGGNRFVDIPNLFRNFDADETDPDSYDFAFTDVLLEAMHEYDLKPIFRLGVTIENQAHIKAYRIHPPKDFAKWARICEHVIRHYNEGWANGFHYDIEYWEIWNEADNGPKGKNQMWTGTPEQYFELYTVTAKHLKAVFGDKIKVGGYGATGYQAIFHHPEKYGIVVPDELDKSYYNEEKYPSHLFRLEFTTAFFEYISKHNAPLDFFSWHSYRTTPQTVVMAQYLDGVMSKYGYGNVETHLNEWNNVHTLKQHGTAEAAALSAEMLIRMHKTKTYMLCYYDSRIGASLYGGMFNAYTQNPTPVYYVFKAFGGLYNLGTQVECRCDIKDVYAIAAKDGDDRAVLMTNVGEDTRICDSALSGMSVYLIDEGINLEKTDLDPVDFVLKTNQTVLIKTE